MKDHDKTSVTETSKAATSDQHKRRKAVKNILLAGGGAMTASQLGNAKWAKPVMDSVVLPAHAETSNKVESDEVGSSPGFSTIDPAVYLTYECEDASSPGVIVDIGGHLNVQTPGIKVKLALSWFSNGVLTGGSPIIIEVMTAADGSYSSTGHTESYYIDKVTVVASLPDFPESGTAEDVINPNFDGSYYCVAPDE